MTKAANAIAKVAITVVVYYLMLTGRLQTSATVQAHLPWVPAWAVACVAVYALASLAVAVCRVKTRVSAYEDLVHDVAAARRDLHDRGVQVAVT
ncbi:dolichol-phosphate mannosyltransferase subunit 3 [Lipomyces japonicus]|uniref:dolichol-phosphate mannosyltransferase subunit 3 n=1 Tax=Lipomyces japonicus TaxID=56871 RepID=UPI0034CDD197